MKRMVKRRGKRRIWNRGRRLERNIRTLRKGRYQENYWSLARVSARLPMLLITNVW